MKFLSICSGIEAASVAWHPLGWNPVAFAEIEPFPCALLHHHYPQVPNWGDITKFKSWPHEPIDILVGGPPCQSFSLAGLRGGLDDPRGNLTLTYLAIAKQYRPAWTVYENVPGLLSVDRGRTFGRFLSGLGELGYGVAYRVLDSQFVRVDGFGRAVPQRRRRIFVVGYLGDWRRAAAVLFDRESFAGNPPPSRSAGERPAGTFSARPTGGGGLGTDFECDGGLVARCVTSSQTRLDGDSQDFVACPYADNASHESQLVRRLTPMECERLMGFPDDYTLIPYNGRLAKDGPRYRAIGNSMAVNCMRWIGRRIQMMESIQGTKKPAAPNETAG